MMLILHILIAVTSIIITTFTYIRPSKLKLVVAYSLVGLTIASGFDLVVQAPSHMMEACLAGLAYLAVVSVGIVAAQIKYVRLAAASRER